MSEQQVLTIELRRHLRQVETARDVVMLRAALLGVIAATERAGAALPQAVITEVFVLVQDAVRRLVDPAA